MGATGYSGAELVAILHRHPAVKLCALMSSASRKDDVPFSQLHASLRGIDGPRCEPYSFDRLAKAGAEVVFLATPNETSAELAGALLSAGMKVIDLSGAFRLRDAGAYPTWYGFPHPEPARLHEARYVVPELLGAAELAGLAGTALIANPGCYATSVILALWPVRARVSSTEATIADCKSGASGAGKRSELAYSFTELAQNFKTYAARGHRHEPEIRQTLGWSAERPFVFVPHLLPVPRGILSSVYVPLSSEVTPEDIAADFARAYAGRPFVTVRSHGDLPELNDVVGTPRCDLGFQILPGARRLLVVSVLDNLLKGAASQAVQNFNLACGLAETVGLS